jgi:hypothetical protein
MLRPARASEWLKWCVGLLVFAAAFLVIGGSASSQDAPASPSPPAADPPVVMTVDQVRDIALTYLGQGAAVLSTQPLQLLSQVHTLEPAFGTPTPAVDFGPVWVVRGIGSFVTNEPVQGKYVHSSTGYLVIDDRTQMIIGYGFP